MKKNFLFIIFLFCSIVFVNAQNQLVVEHKIENGMSSEITSALGGADITTISTLKITGDANLTLTDCHAIRDAFKISLYVLDLSNAKFADNKIPNGGADEGAFSGMNIEDIIFPVDLVEVGDRAFHSCEFLFEATMPNSVKRIGTYAFFICLELTLSTLPEDLETLEAYAFQDCKNLKVASLSAGLKGTLGARTFQNCSNITISKLPAGITALAGYVFQNCKKIPSMTFSDDFESIGNRTFNGCTGLTELRFKGTKPPTCTLPAAEGTDNDSFLGANKAEITVYVPTGAKEAFNKAPWNNMKSIEEYDPTSSINTIESNHFNFYLDADGNIIFCEDAMNNHSWRVSIYDLTGNMLLNQPLNNSNGLNISHLPKGIYIINVGNTAYKFIW